MSDLERPILREEFDNMPREVYAGLGHPVHRFAEFIPVADDKDQYALRESIKAIGQVEPIVLYEGAILDGRHRYKAATLAGLEPKTVEFEGDDEAALQFVLAKNVARRNLTTIQKLTLREKIVPEIERLNRAARLRMLAGSNPGQPVVEGSGRVDEAVADLIGVSRETQRQFDRVREIAADVEEADDFLQRMLNDEVSVKKAYEAVKNLRSTSDELDALAKKDTSKTDEMKQRAALASAIGKAHALLVNADPGILQADNVVADKLEELLDWVEQALDAARG